MLLARDHYKKDIIDKRYDYLMTRWNNLLGLSEARRHRLLVVQAQFKEIEDLFLAFAKKASAFNSWFENAEEDLTDPVSVGIRFGRISHRFFTLGALQFD